MNASSGLYPSLGRYFKTITELAHAGCMSKTRVKLMHSKRFDYQDLEDAHAAWSGEFDEIFKKG